VSFETDKRYLQMQLCDFENIVGIVLSKQNIFVTGVQSLNIFCLPLHTTHAHLKHHGSYFCIAVYYNPIPSLFSTAAMLVCQTVCKSSLLK